MWQEIQQRSQDAERQVVNSLGTGDYGGEDTDRETLRQKTTPGMPS